MLKMQSITTQTAASQTSAFSGAAVASDRAYSVSAQITTVGSGATATAQLQKSNDGTNWVSDGSSVAVGTSGTYWVEKLPICAKYVRITYTVSAGTLTSVSTLIAVQVDIP